MRKHASFFRLRILEDSSFPEVPGINMLSGMEGTSHGTARYRGSYIFSYYQKMMKYNKRGDGRRREGKREKS